MPRSMASKGRRRFIKSTAAAGSLALIGTAGCVGDNGSEQELFIGSTYDSNDALQQNMEDWAETLEEESDGEIQVSFESSYGGEAEIMEQTESGGIDGNLMGDLWLTQSASELTWIASPFILDSWEEQEELFMETDYGQQAREAHEEALNQRLMVGPIGRGPRVLTANTAVETPADLTGLDLRVPEIEAWVEVWNGLGASATSVSFDELYGALEQGVVDAQENPPPQLSALSIWEVQSHLMTTDHIHMTGWMNINQDVWDSISENHQELIEDTLADAIDSTTEELHEGAEENLDEAEDNGIEIVEVDQDEWQEEAEPVLEGLFESGFWDGSLEEAREF